MYPVTQAFKAAVRTSHKARVRAEVWRSGQYVRTLKPVTGSVDIDSRRAQRRTCSMTVVAEDPTVRATPVFNTYDDISTVGGGEPDYAALAAAYPTYESIKAIVGYDETLVDDGLVPTTTQSDLAPYGNEIRVWRGIEVERDVVKTYGSLLGSGDYADLAAAYDTYGALALSDQTETLYEEVPLGVFTITDVTVAASPDGGSRIDINGVDRSARIARALWIDPFPIADGTALGTAISNVLTDRWPAVETDLEDAGKTVPAVTLGLQESGSGKDPWADVQNMAQSAGLDLYFDGDGIAVLTAVSDPSTATPSAVYEEGEDAVVMAVTRRLSTEQAVNGVVASGEGSQVTPPVRAVVFDEDPDSPTYRYGEFGERPVFMSSPLILTEDDAYAVASAELAKRKGAEENVDWTVVCDPSLDAGDVIQLTNSGTRLDKLLVIDRLTIPLTVDGAMSATARTIRVVTGAA